MSNLETVSLGNVSSEQKELFGQIEGAFGAVPNMFKTIGHSAAALESMWTSFGALGKGAISAKMGEKIAVLVADINRCDYCLAAHTTLGQNAGLSLSELSDAQRCHSNAKNEQVVLDFAKKLVAMHGKVDKSDIEVVRAAGYSDAEITEILAHVALNIFTNYTNVAFDVEVDFPKVDLT